MCVIISRPPQQPCGLPLFLTAPVSFHWAIDQSQWRPLLWMSRNPTTRLGGDMRSAPGIPKGKPFAWNVSNADVHHTHTHIYIYIFIHMTHTHTHIYIYIYGPDLRPATPQCYPPQQPPAWGSLAIYDHPSRSHMLYLHAGLVPSIHYLTGYLHAVFTTAYMAIQSIDNVLLPKKPFIVAI